jgi:basic amino acid/polyamine antiporter, APA family
VAVTTYRNPSDAGIGVLITLAGLPVYWFWSRYRKNAAVSA